MGDFVFVVLVLGGLGVFFYRQSQEKQAQRAAEVSDAASCASGESASQPVESVDEPQAQKAESADGVAETKAEEPVVEETAPEKESVDAQEEPKVPAEETYDALTWRVLQRVMEQPGILQTEIYGLFPKENRKHLQATLLQLDKENVLRREKEGNTYRLFPV
ncbi:hypothetical protein [uncultured Desulfuromonas sp.]|uniref:hypothetical protein n=1 Tax=uncultured Desulfuromonas sp. TaxID=181013 RepID=UPI002AAA736A|nr:hypothetical protein [uncultured Desulfuromonas sp.]